MLETLGLADPLDRIELRKGLERSFGVRFDTAEAAQCRTVADIFEMLSRHVGPARPGRCATAMVFYRLRRTFTQLGAVDVRVPGSDIAAACRTMSVRHLLAALEQESGLKLPPTVPGRLGQLGACLVLAAIPSPLWLLPVAAVAPVLAVWWLPAIPLGCGMALLWAAPRRLPAGCETLGGLSRRTAALNHGALSAGGAASSPRELQAALLELLAGFIHVPVAEIGLSTRIVELNARAA